MKATLANVCAWLLTVLMAGAATAQVGEWGDAPESALAYPATGVMGAFPTCQNIGPAAWIYHGPLCWAFFGPSCDFEIEGNAGMCPLFNPYDMDECFADGDAGLLVPQAFTIVGVNVLPCIGFANALGAICSPAMWGPNVDIQVTNTMPVTGYVNVLLDWDQNGMWGGAPPCPNGPAPEHALVDFPVPIGFSGPLSALMPPGFLIGPNPGYVWCRFSITERPVGPNWNGAGTFEDGESEDYLLYVDASVEIKRHSWGMIKGTYR
jgi:hypothetical protein